MLRRITEGIRRYASTTRRILELEAKLVIAEMHRDKLAEMLVDERNRTNHEQPESDGRLRFKLTAALDRFGLAVDGEPDEAELFAVVVEKLNELDEQLGDVFDLAEEHGMPIAGHSPAGLLSEALDDLEVARNELAEANGRQRQTQALVDWRLRAVALIDELASKTNQAPPRIDIRNAMNRLVEHANKAPSESEAA